MQIIETIDFRDIQIVWEFNSKNVSCFSYVPACEMRKNRSRNMLLIYRIVVPF